MQKVRPRLRTPRRGDRAQPTQRRRRSGPPAADGLRPHGRGSAIARPAAGAAREHITDERRVSLDTVWTQIKRASAKRNVRREAEFFAMIAGFVETSDTPRTAPSQPHLGAAETGRLYRQCELSTLLVALARREPVNVLRMPLLVLNVKMRSMAFYFMK